MGVIFCGGVLNGWMSNLLQKSYLKGWPAKYELLDGIRGLACILVVLHHVGVVTVGHASVMVFFVISGYCITASTQAGLCNGLSCVDMLGRRARRIFPPYLLAVAFFVVTRWVRMKLDPAQSWSPDLLTWIQNLTLTQWLSLPFGNYGEASQNPTLFVASFWSLNYEEQFYLVMAGALLLAGRYSIDLIYTVVALTALGLVWNLCIPGGWASSFFLEYWVHFSIGAFLCFTLTSGGRHAWWLFWSAVLGLSCFSLWQMLPWQGDQTWQEKRVYVEWLTVSLAAFLMAVLRPYSDAISQSILWRPIAAVGTISYSLYLVHQFNLRLVNTVASKLLPAATPYVFVVTLVVLLHIGIGAIFWWFCERPFVNRRREQPVRVVS